MSNPEILIDGGPTPSGTMPTQTPILLSESPNPIEMKRGNISQTISA